MAETVITKNSLLDTKFLDDGLQKHEIKKLEGIDIKTISKKAKIAVTNQLANICQNYCFHYIKPIDPLNKDNSLINHLKKNQLDNLIFQIYGKIYNLYIGEINAEYGIGEDCLNQVLTHVFNNSSLEDKNSLIYKVKKAFGGINYQKLFQTVPIITQENVTNNLFNKIDQAYEEKLIELEKMENQINDGDKFLLYLEFCYNLGYYNDTENDIEYEELVLEKTIEIFDKHPDKHEVFWNAIKKQIMLNHNLDNLFGIVYLAVLSKNSQFFSGLDQIRSSAEINKEFIIFQNTQKHYPEIKLYKAISQFHSSNCYSGLDLYQELANQCNSEERFSAYIEFVETILQPQGKKLKQYEKNLDEIIKRYSKYSSMQKEFRTILELKSKYTN